MKYFGLTGNLISMKFVGTFFVVSIMTLYGMTESSIIPSYIFTVVATTCRMIQIITFFAHMMFFRILHSHQNLLLLHF